MFKIILQPEERAMLFLIQQGLYPPGREPDPLVLRLIALQLVDVDEQWAPRLTDLAQAALARMEGALH
jgi:hypothetical protein